MASIEWFRLWHDMPNDPKWRTISRASGQPISTVLAVALHLMVDASRNVTRGHVTVTAEDVASAIDVTDDAVEAIFSAMQGRILNGDRLTGWDRRQPKREDVGDYEGGVKSAAQRKREQRAREKMEAEGKHGGDVTRCHAMSRDVTLDKDKDKETDKDKDKEADKDKEKEKERTASEETTGVGAPIAESASRDAPPTPADQTEKTSATSATLPPATRKSATRLPEEWVLPKAWGDWALDERPDMTAEDVRGEGECFADYWHAKAGADARKADWLATWRNWVRRANGGGGRLVQNRGRPDNSQQAIEERNRAVLAQWAQGSSDH